MVLTTVNDEILDDYYTTKPYSVKPCNNNTKTHWWGFTPYDLEETIYWGIKHLTLPGIAVLIIAIILVLRLFESPIMDSIVYILGSVAGFSILSVIRECMRARKYKIPKGEIKVRYDNRTQDEDKLFKIPLNKITEPKFKIGFVGDIMKMNDFKLKFEQHVIDFFKGVNIIVGNLEGIVSLKKGFVPKQRHKDPPILTQLKTLLTNDTKWLLCLSNNHSIDFSNADFHTSLNQIQADPRFDVFGRNDVPNILVRDIPINISTATEWSNQKNWDCISNYNHNGVNSYHCPKKFNILFPHWGFENEKYVRTRVRKDAEALLTGVPQKYSKFQIKVRKWFKKKIYPCPDKNWDLIFGHHSHVRQPIMKVKENVTNKDKEKRDLWKLVAFSGGNFTSGANIIRNKKHNRGIIMKCEIGPLKGHKDKFAAANIEWRNTINNKGKEKEIVNGKEKMVPTKTVSIDRKKYRTYNLSALIIGIIIIVITVFFSVVDLLI
ncbi:MAG TPA: CapA family protein [Candidatus Nanopelagicaceae bacterium]|nr:CapA family protein [Candidatus Nanopelagicaceae bacterium]